MIANLSRPLRRFIVSRLFSVSKGPQADSEDLLRNIESNYKTMHAIYDKKPSNIQDYRKMLVYRSKNLGMKELDLLIGTWAEVNLKTLDRDQLNRYEEEIIQMETPDLHKILSSSPSEFAKEDLPEDHYLSQIRAFGERPGWKPFA